MRQPTVTMTHPQALAQAQAALAPQSARRPAGGLRLPLTVKAQPLLLPLSLPAMDERRLTQLIAMLGHAAMAEVLESYGDYLREGGEALLDALTRGDAAAIDERVRAMMGAALELATPRLAALCRDLLSGVAPIDDPHTAQALDVVLLASRAGVEAACHRCRHASPALPGQGVARLRMARG